jgi:hypothetical protein
MITIAPLVLEMPMPELQTNSPPRALAPLARRSHAEKLAYWEMLDMYVVLNRIPEPPASPIATATIRSVMYLGGAMDDDNAIARHKSAIDWLRKRRYIADDRRKNLRWESLPEQIVKRDGHYRLVLTITPTE